ncbi:IS1096 element passenger TnpR family protein [Amycolatopsis sp. CA-230715]|uniref:IS1096 element passenger TnpR family protein n=1 Tax=Amycolatopsis sp. CA-230715 TaxID=2745196 RepID=UPI001C0338F1|nr:plasmid pRiA4b ORF-3 family protein [Amycolatopsis sp. CA-230715]QWF81859.1 hypothetical protein HUW46_05292 [Amycolatopsis sp. CA-230715]
MTTAVTKLARSCEAVDQIHRIVAWVGDGKPVTPKGVLRPAELRRASEATGVPIPAKFRSAADVPRWHRLWSAAIATDLISLEMDAAKAGAPQEFIPETWLTAFTAALAANFDDEEGVAALHVGRAVLTALASGRVKTFEELAHRVWHDLRTDYHLDVGRLWSSMAYEESAAPQLTELLAEFGVTAGPWKLSELGKWALAEFVRRGDDLVAKEPYVAPGRVCQLKITLMDVSPACWRRVLVPSTTTLGELHWVLQAALRWDNDHLHGFTVGTRHYGDPAFDRSDEYETTVGEAFTRARQRISYTYDFGDNWRHDIQLERTLDIDEALTYPLCIAGKGPVPVEDSDHRTIPFDQADINRRLSSIPVEEDAPFDAVIEQIVVDAYGEEEQIGSFLTVLDDVLTFPAEASVLGHPVTVLELRYEDLLRGPFAVCQNSHGTGEITLTDVCFPPDTTAAWVHAAYRHFLGADPFPATARPDWHWPPD